MVSTDKPVYQPGQTVHVRVLALDSLALKPAGGQAAQMRIRNPQSITLVDQALALERVGGRQPGFRARRAGRHRQISDHGRGGNGRGAAHS